MFEYFLEPVYVFYNISILSNSSIGSIHCQFLSPLDNHQATENQKRKKYRKKKGIRTNRNMFDYNCFDYKVYACQTGTLTDKMSSWRAVTLVDSAVIETRFLSDNPTGKLLQIRKPLSREAFDRPHGPVPARYMLVSFDCSAFGNIVYGESPVRDKTIEGLCFRGLRTTLLVTVSVIHRGFEGP